MYNDPNTTELTRDYKTLYEQEKAEHEKTKARAFHDSIKERNGYYDAMRKLSEKFVDHIEQHHRDFAAYLIEQAEIESGIA